MKVLFAVSNESISESIVKKYQQMYKEIISYKNVYYFNAILKELQKDKTYDRVVISEDLEPFANNNYEAIDNFIFEKLDSISDEASTNAGEDIPIILITTDRRTKSENLLIKLFGIGVYSALIGQDRSIEQVCNLINKPRTKKEAKIYYQIDSNNVEYKAESEGDVSEVEIQNILTHYKRLGRNEERYVDSFNSIAAQYTDEQLKVIIKFLPLNVKAVLEANCPRYQQIMAFSGGTTKKAYGDYSKKTDVTDRKKENKTKTKRIKDGQVKLPDDNGIKIESIVNKATTKKLTNPVIIPSEVSTKNIKKVDNIDTKPERVVPKPIEKVENIKDTVVEEEEFPGFEDISMPEPVPEQPVKRGRGRPKKIQPIEETTNVIEEAPAKKKRGRPRKVQVEEVAEPAVLPGFDDEEEENSGFLPGFENTEDKEETMLPGFEEEDSQEESFLPGFEETMQEDEEPMPTYENRNYQQPEEPRQEASYQMPSNSSYQIQNTSTIENLLTRDKKVVAFVGTSKNGTSFLVNNIAEMLSGQGIKTAILDLTKNRNAYYIYTKNEEDLRRIAFECTQKLSQGYATGIQVNKNLDVYTSLPGEDGSIEEYENILTTLVQNYSLVLLDCDFDTNYNYLANSQEIYLVQSMDVLTIQPLTAYLRDLKAKGILAQEKLRIVINKYTRVRSVTEKTIIGGMAFYNDPAMSYMTELFNRETVKYVTIPFEMQTYTKYLEALVNCHISLNGYSKEFMTSLRKLANMVYPLISTGTQNYNNKNKYGKNAKQPMYNNYENNFSSNMNSTLDRMKKY
ncbi:MAG: hypothetical protein ACLU84_00155 [Clostridia bacterium]